MSLKEHDAGLAVGANAFHEATGRKAYLARAQEIINQRIDPATGLVRAELAHERACPLCNESSARQIFVKNGFPHLRCQSCSMVYVNPILRPDLIEERYQASESADGWLKVLLTKAQRDFDRPKFVSGLQWLEERNGKGKILDVGCGSGHFLEIAKERSWKVTGLEMHENSAAHCRSLGIPVPGGLIEESGLPEGEFDAITLWDVLPHIPNPRPVLRAIRRALAPDGALLMLVANVDSLAARILQEKCNLFSGAGYVNLYSLSTLTRLLEEEGFRLSKKESTISELSVIQNYLRYQDPYFGKTEGAEMVFDFLTPEEIHRRFLGYKMLVLAEKS